MSPKPKLQNMAIVIHIDAAHAAEFEAMFEAEEIPIWDEYTAKGMFKECSLTRVNGGSDIEDGVQAYLLHILTTEKGHDAHDKDPRFNRFLKKAQKLQPSGAYVFFGDTVFERRA